jgi:ClpP class serine protease
VDQVAKNRGVSSEKVLKDMADGRIFIGKQAITAGLVDGVSTLDRLINTVLPVLQADKQEAKVLSELNNSFRKELSNYGHD